MNINSIYQDLTPDQFNILDEILADKVRSRLLLNIYNSNRTRYWMAIFANYLRKVDKRIMLTSSKYYYKQTDLDYYYPTQTDSERIGPPFDTSAAASELEIQFVETTTGAKIYEYASALCKAQPEHYIDRPSLAVSLTEDRTHKVKIIHSNNTVWVLSNRFSEDFIEKCLALFPFLFDLKEIQEDETIMNVCKAVAKEEPIKEYFKELFDSLEKIREEQKISLIKTALNSRITQAAENTEREINRVKDNIDSEESRLERYYAELEELQLKHIGLLSKKGYEDEQVQEIIDFINRNRFIQNVSVKPFNYGYSGTKINMLLLDIIAPITAYEPEPLDRFITARLEEYGRDTTKGKILRAFRRIFVEQELQMICETYVRLDLTNIEMNANYSTLGYSYYDYKRLCQPHLTRYNCWGDNQSPIKQMLRDGDIVGALNNIVIATQNINFTDAAVLNAFLDIIAGNSCMMNVKSCLSKADGQLWSIKDVIDQLDREDLENQTIGTPALVDTIPEADALDAV